MTKYYRWGSLNNRFLFSLGSGVYKSKIQESGSRVSPGAPHLGLQMKTAHTHLPSVHIGLPCSSSGKESPCNAGDQGSIPGSGRSSGKGNGNNTPVFYPRELHGQRSLAGYSPWSHKESDTAVTNTNSVHTPLMSLHVPKFPPHIRTLIDWIRAHPKALL